MDNERAQYTATERKNAHETLSFTYIHIIEAREKKNRIKAHQKKKKKFSVPKYNNKYKFFFVVRKGKIVNLCFFL